MAVTKILPRNGGLKEAIDYVLNGDKTDGHILTAHFNCDPGREYREMMKTKLETGRLDSVNAIPSFNRSSLVKSHLNLL